MRRMPTVKDVAVKAGVSVGTVSRVLAGETAVKPALRDKVNDVIATLGYRPNVTARALRTNRTDVIGLIVPDITNPFFAQMAASVERSALAVKHTVMLASSHDDPDEEVRHIRAFLDRSVRGIIVAASRGNHDTRMDSPVPIVSLDRRFGSYPLVSTHHAKAAALVADHLYALGHRRIAYIAGPTQTEAARLRQEGFVTRLEQLGSQGDPVALEIVAGRFDYQSGETAAAQFLSRSAGERPTAIAAASDQQAIGALRAARDFKIDIPEQLSVVGFDDITLANLVVPRLTTVRQPTDQLAQRAVQHLLDDSHTPGDETIEATLVVRDSTGPAPLKA
jgi:LacI family transcriptional regulator